MKPTDVMDARVQFLLDTAHPEPMTGDEASQTTARLADEIYHRWCEAVGAERSDESAWLAEVSHALQRAGRVLVREGLIG